MQSYNIYRNRSVLFKKYSLLQCVMVVRGAILVFSLFLVMAGKQADMYHGKPLSL